VVQAKTNDTCLLPLHISVGPSTVSVQCDSKRTTLQRANIYAADPELWLLPISTQNNKEAKRYTSITLDIIHGCNLSPHPFFHVASTHHCVAFCLDWSFIQSQSQTIQVYEIKGELNSNSRKCRNFSLRSWNTWLWIELETFLWKLPSHDFTCEQYK